MHYRLFFFFLFMSCGVLHAQQPSFTASVSSRRVAENGFFDIRFELTEAQGSSFQPPSFSDFQVMGGPARGSSTMIVNGVVSRSESWSYTLMAKRKGSFTIGAASVMAGRKKLSTAPITIEVSAAQDHGSVAGKGEEGSIYLIAEVENKNYYPGQQIILNYRLLFQQNVQNLNILSEEDYADFFVQSFAQFSKDPAIERINGQEYTSRIIKSIALFPHQSGSYVIDPLVLDVGVDAPFQGIQGFFTMRRMQDVRVASKPLTIKVLPLPDGAPPDFHGAVGTYSMKTIPGRSVIAADDALTFQLDIEGNGDAKRWGAPVLRVDSLLEAFEPKIISDETAEVNGEIINHRQIEYQLLPHAPGRFSIAVPFTYFDPEQKKYVTLHSDTMSLAVTESTHRGALATADDTQTMDTALRRVGSPWLSDRFWTSWPHLLLFGLIVTGSCWTVLARWKQQRADRIPEAVRVKQDAPVKAMLALDKLQSGYQHISGEDFFSGVTEIFQHFLLERFSIPADHLDEGKLPGYLESTPMETADRENLMAFFRQSLIWRYAGTPNEEARQAILNRCREIVRKA